MLAIMGESQVKDFILMNKRILILIQIALLLGCQPTVEQSGIPNVAVNVEVILSDIDNAALQQIGGYIYLQGGVRGIILFRESQSQYRAFDRNCTYQPSDPAAIIEVNASGFYMEDLSCKSNFDLGGFPTDGPAEFPLKEYNVSLAGDFLLISN
jgi:hypothetical protein